MNEEYKKSLETKAINELTDELQKIHDNLDMLFTVNNSLDTTDITQGGGEPADQERYKTLKWQEKTVTEEINKRHLLEILK